jgi:hypothetical protein
MIKQRLPAKNFVHRLLTSSLAFCESRKFVRILRLSTPILPWLAVFSGATANAGALSLRFGPPGVGTGGTNPVGLPPGPTDMELGYVTQSKWETSLSAVPGLFLGKRIDFSGPYVSLGGGIAISANGVGPGPYSAFGYDLGSGAFRFNIEYKHAIGITQSGYVSPYALRIGIAWY